MAASILRLPKENGPPKKYGFILVCGRLAKWRRADDKINDVMPSNFTPTFSLFPWLYDYSLRSVTAILTTKVFESSWQ